MMDQSKPMTGERPTKRSAESIDGLSQSAAFLALVDSILGLDRKTVSTIFASYLYFKGSGRSDGELLAFIATRHPRVIASVAIEVLPSIATALIKDVQFRDILLSILRSSLRGTDVVRVGP
jgi:hypothetical protein